MDRRSAKALLLLLGWRSVRQLAAQIPLDAETVSRVLEGGGLAENRDKVCAAVRQRFKERQAHQPGRPPVDPIHHPSIERLIAELRSPVY